MKRSPELRDLSDDHHDVLVMARRARRTPGGGEAFSVAEVWSQLASFWESDLAPHFQLEERLLLPALERAGLGGLVERARSEHRAIRAALADERERDAEALAAVGRLLDAHVRFEERVLFETAQERLEASALEPVAAATRGRAKVCPTYLARR